MNLTPVVIERHQNFWIARDDLLPGGTKRRALVKWLPTLNADHFYYAGSVYGSGGWALAEACKDLGFECTLVLAESKYKPDWINSLTCNLEWRDAQPVQSIYDSLILGASAKHMVLPLGFDHAGFSEAVSEVIKSITITPSEIWMPCVSGTLVRSARIAFPDIPLNAVCTAKHHGETGNAKLYYANEKYHQPAASLPPYPANIFSDAKLWSFVRQFALKDALVWNTSI